MTGDDEFSAMAANLNKMASDIRTLMDKEREAERTKNELITNVAHDLRTPLTSIIGYLELLAGNTKVPAEMEHKYIEIAYSKARRLEKLIEDLIWIYEAELWKDCHARGASWILLSCSASCWRRPIRILWKRTCPMTFRAMFRQRPSVPMETCWPGCLITSLGMPLNTGLTASGCWLRSMRRMILLPCRSLITAMSSRRTSCLFCLTNSTG